MLFHEIPSTIRQVVPPAAEPLAAADLRLQLRTDSTFEDALIAEYITAAREIVESDARRPLVYRSFQLAMDRFPECDIELRFPPVVAVQSVQYLDSAGDLQTLDDDLYVVDLISEPARIFPAFGTFWPITQAMPNAVLVNFTAGYATPISSVDTATETLTVPRLFTAGDAFQLFNSGGALPAGLSAGTIYYVKSPTSTTLQLSLTSGGSAVNITGSGTGASFIGAIPAKAIQAIKLLVSHWFRNREIAGKVGPEIEMAYSSLLNRLRWGGLAA